MAPPGVIPGKSTSIYPLAAVPSVPVCIIVPTKFISSTLFNKLTPVPPVGTKRQLSFIPTFPQGGSFAPLPTTVKPLVFVISCSPIIALPVFHPLQICLSLINTSTIPVDSYKTI